MPFFGINRVVVFAFESFRARGFAQGTDIFFVIRRLRPHHDWN